MTTVRYERRCLDAVASLDRACFHPDELLSGEDVDRCRWWIARTAHGEAVGFAGARKAEAGTVYLSRAGVAPGARGHGLQRRMIQARVEWARRSDADVVVTYTVHSNVASANSLIACGFRLYEPALGWAGRDNVIYWRKDL